MTIYMTSDLHVDHYINHRVSLENYIYNALKPADVLCVAGDTCDDPHLFVEFYKAVSPRYKKIFVVFGNHDLTVHNDSYFRNNPFTKTQAKLDFLKAEVSKLGNVSILDGTVEEFEGVKFGGTMAFNDWTWAFNLNPAPDGNIPKFLYNWHYWFDYVNWNYMNNKHPEILWSEMKKLDHVVAQKPDIIMTHYIPLFFGVEKEYYYSESTTYFYFNGEKYLDQLKDQSIWLAGHTHSVRTKDLLQGDGRTIHLKLNPVGYPDEDSGNAERMDEFLLEK
ncbi:MAG: metallophosphoesterase [Treponema sp.]|nr:metallophosphoesterase [Treponema sp.]